MKSFKTSYFLNSIFHKSQEKYISPKDKKYLKPRRYKWPLKETNLSHRESCKKLGIGLIESTALQGVPDVVLYKRWRNKTSQKVQGTTTTVKSESMNKACKIQTCVAQHSVSENLMLRFTQRQYSMVKQTCHQDYEQIRSVLYCTRSHFRRQLWN